MKVKWTTALITAMFSGALAVGGAATAGGMGSGMKGHETTQGTSASGSSGSTMDFSKVDEDGNGFISRAEAARHGRLGDNFKRLDRNQDRQLDKAEFSRFETMTKEAPGQTKEHEEEGAW